MILTLIASAILLSVQLTEINAHGLLQVPIARSSAWRTDPSKFPAYYNDMEMSCGGKSVQWDQNGGKCSICGEKYGSKRFEKGGDMYRGFVVKTYTNTQNIDITLDIWTNHRGWYEFRLCNVDTMPGGEATQECLNKVLLKDINGNSRINAPSHMPSEGKGTAYVSLRIPSGFKCNHCVLQWKWNVGNSHGADFQTGAWCMGCGPQEQFYGCSDIRITDGGSQPIATKSTQKPAATTTSSNNGSSGVAPIWGQCGGNGWTGPKKCVPGTTCKVQNEWYSQCLP